MTFSEAIESGFRNYANGGGRASRSEFWYWTLFSVLVDLACWGIDHFILQSEMGLLGLIVGLALLLPDLAVTARRLHDVDRSFWWILIGLTGIGLVLLLYWWCLKGTAGPNRFGPDPLWEGRASLEPASPR